MKLLLSMTLLVPFIAQAVELRITHPRVEQKETKVYEIDCELKCIFSTSDMKKLKGSVDKNLIAKDLAELEALAPKVKTKETPSPVERGSRIVMIKQKSGTFSKFYLPPAASWTKDQLETNLKVSELLTKIEFQVDKARGKKK